MSARARLQIRAVVCGCISLLVMIALLCCGRALQVSAAGRVPAQAAAQPVAEAGPGWMQTSAYAGDAECVSCHSSISASYAHTAHHLTSQTPSATAIEGSFAPGSNRMLTANPQLIFEMNAGPGGTFTETGKATSPSGQVHEVTQPIDIVVGSGRKGQTYLYWKGDLLFELPVSYWVANHSWINSPGFPDGSGHFDRPITPRCLECHASYFLSEVPPINRFDRASLVLGIGCERCHGPGAEHVRRERQGPRPAAGSAEEAILNPAHLPRDRQIDVCAVCHAGIGTSLQPSLSFKPGDVLADFVRSPQVTPGAPMDVHTNQVQLLEASKCFRSSGTMTCSTCHNVHTPQRDPAAFAPRCLTCHRMQQCGEFKVEHAAIRTRCIDCHMPLQHSHVLVSQSGGQRLTPEVRNHLIAIYPREQTTWP